MSGPSIDASMLWPLLIMMLAFKLYFAAVVLVRIRGEILAARIRALRMAQVQAAGAEVARA